MEAVVLEAAAMTKKMLAFLDGEAVLALWVDEWKMWKNVVTKGLVVG